MAYKSPGPNQAPGIRTTANKVPKHSGNGPVSVSGGKAPKTANVSARAIRKVKKNVPSHGPSLESVQNNPY